MAADGLPAPGRFSAALLYAPSLLYRGAVALRNRLYDAGWLPADRLPGRVVSLGNLAVGGTGKTPLTSCLAGHLVQAGYRVAVLSRGYARRGGGAPLLVSDGRTVLAEPVWAGDEPWLIARDNPSVPVAVGADRRAAARLVTEASPVEVFLLDDAYQHRRIARDLDLLLVDGSDALGNGRMLPFGPLREPESSLARADAVVLTRSEGDIPPALASLLNRYNPEAPVFHARIEPVAFVRQDGTSIASSALEGFTAYAFCGIARPGRFEHDLLSTGLRLAGVRRFPDHHPFSRRALEEVVHEARRTGAEILVTTEKDLVRMTSFPEGAPALYALSLRVTFPESPGLVDWVIERLHALPDGAPGANRPQVDAP